MQGIDIYVLKIIYVVIINRRQCGLFMIYSIFRFFLPNHTKKSVICLSVLILDVYEIGNIFNRSLVI